MNFELINCIQSEWLKKKRSLASWLVFAGAFFVPLIILASRVKNVANLPAINAADDFWQRIWRQSWEAMAIILLPMGIILAASLITQIETKNNAWKQLHATPQRFTSIYFAKLFVVIVMLAEVFLLFNLGIYLSAILPSFIFLGIPLPSAPFPFEFFLKGNLDFFIECLPILSLQYLISLQFKNFLIPLGSGILIWVMGAGMLSWEYSYLLPYIQCGIDFLKSSGNLPGREFPASMPLISAIYFAVFTIAGYILYSRKSEKG